MQKIYKSPRFWLVVIIALLQSLAVFNVISGDQVDKLVNIISIALGGIVAIRTVDKMGEARVIAAGVSTGELQAKDSTPTPPSE